MPIHKQQFDPIALIGENIALYYDNSWHYFRVNYLRPLYRSHKIVHDFGSISASSQISEFVQPSDELELKQTEIGQLRLMPLDDIEIDIRTGATDPVSATDGKVTRISRHQGLVDPTWAASEHFYKADRLYYFGVYNPYATSTGQSRVAFWGWKFDVTELEDEPDKKTMCPHGRW